MAWGFKDIPSQEGTVAIVTGANSGIGYPTARELGLAGAHVILACRSAERAEVALGRLSAEAPGANFEYMPLDLADLDSVESFVEQFRDRHDSLNILVNNAGVMIPPYTLTKQGFELQFGTNHLGHFALTGRLLGILNNTPNSRVVTVSSLAHNMSKIRFDDLHFEKRYRPWKAYGQSKVANLLFTYELSRRLTAEQSSTMAVAAHPGWTNSKLQRNFMTGRLAGPALAMSPAAGAKPTLRAATDPTVQTGEYYGPRGPFEIWGAPVRVGSNAYSQQESVAKELWDVSQTLTGVQFLDDAA